ncbi:hypothetical protein JHK82_042872 [Glycine max]|nr:hypothetical protein JHK85_043518 [Glycine max]KAG5105902.1 hypothetical protein JHK82_042872 [Glycine max]
MCKKFKEQSGTTQSTLNTEGKPEAARKTEVARKNQRRKRKQGPICAGKETDAALCSNGGACGNNKEKTQKNYSFVKPGVRFREIGEVINRHASMSDY